MFILAWHNAKWTRSVAVCDPSGDIGCSTQTLTLEVPIDVSISALRIAYKAHPRPPSLYTTPRCTTMSSCTLQFARNSPLRTTLFDETTGHAKYQIDTPIRIAGSVTRIRKLDPLIDRPPRRDDHADSDSDDDFIHRGKEGSSESEKPLNDREDDLETVEELPETSDEIARIYWKWFSSDELIFQGKRTSRDVFLPKCGKMKG